MIISPDDNLYNNQGLYSWTPERSKASWDKSYQQLISALRTGRYNKVLLMGGLPASGKTTYLTKLKKEENTIYFDATFTNKWIRGKTLNIIKREKPSVLVEMVFLNTPLQTCLERNSKRSEDRRVPQEAYDRMGAAIKKDGFPKKSEGFNRIVFLQ